MIRHQHKELKDWLGSGAINLFGRPFAGKDTQAHKLATLLGGTVLGGGQILRESVVPEAVSHHLSSGKLIPSEAYVNIVLPFLSKKSLAGSPLLLSSVGRWYGEQSGVTKALERSGHDLKAVIYLELDEETVRQRWLKLESHDDRGGRYDDTAAILEVRLKEFREKTVPVIDYYRNAGVLIEIDGSQPSDVVTEDILKQLSAKALHDMENH